MIMAMIKTVMTLIIPLQMDDNGSGGGGDDDNNNGRL